MMRLKSPLQSHIRSKLRLLSTNTIYDVVIVGGGVVGAAVACKLATTPSMKDSKILVVETFPPPPLSKALDTSRPIDVRTYAMTPTSSTFLDTVNAWKPLVDAGRISPYDSMQVWSHGSNKNFIHFDAFNHGSQPLDSTQSPFLGTIVEHTSVQSALFEEMTRLHDEGSLELRCPAKVDKMEFDNLKQGANQGANPALLTLSYSSKENTAPSPSPAERAAGGGSGVKSGGVDEEKVTETVSARLVIAADGAQSPTRKAAGIGTWGWNYAQKAVICTVDVGPDGLASSISSGKESTQGVASIQRFLPTGPIALLPLWKTPKNTSSGEGSSSRQASLIWSTTPQHATYLTSLSEEDFIQEINTAFSSQETRKTKDDGVGVKSVLKSVGQSLLNESLKASQLTGEKSFIPPPNVQSIDSKRFAIDLNFSQSSTFVKWRIALVGDAAHSIHPMAGQGLNMGLQDAAAIVDAIDRSARAGLDIGDPQNFIGEYGKKQYRKNLFMSSSIDFIHRLFGQELGLKQGGPSTISDLPSGLKEFVELSRDLGLKSINAFPPLKTFIVQFAMGAAPSPPLIPRD